MSNMAKLYGRSRNLSSLTSCIVVDVIKVNNHLANLCFCSWFIWTPQKSDPQETLKTKPCLYLPAATGSIFKLVSY